MTRFLRNLFLFSVLLGAGLYGLRLQYGARLVHPGADWLLLFFVALTALTYWLTWRAYQRNPESLTTAWFGTTALRLVLALVVVVTYLVRGGAKAGYSTWTFLGLFFLLYFLYTGFEVWSVVTNLRPFSKPGSEEV
jgi:phosphoglycerol transferase MdoB-like AlkP superfamily enzyme